MTVVEYTTLAQVILVDIVLSGDNAVIIGMAVMGLPERQRRMAMFYGIAAAVAARILFSVFAVYILDIPALKVIGGMWLLWIAYALYSQENSDKKVGDASGNMLRAIWIIAVADISMSLDNVLAVSGAADGHTAILAVGLMFSIIFMAVVSNAIAHMLDKHKWLTSVGTALIVYIGLKMIYGVVS